MQRRSSALIATLLAIVLTACGAPTPPTAALTLTGVTPATALPGDQVTRAGTGITDDHVVTFDGMPASVVSRTATTLVVTVPETYGYPRIAIDDVGDDRLLFVGTDYTGPTTLSDLQDALDGIPENAALRIGAGTFSGTDLALDDRKLFGSGTGSVLDVSGELALYARNVHTTVLDGVSVEGGDVVVRRGRLATASVPSSSISGNVVLNDVDLAIGQFWIDGADYVSVMVRNTTLTADGIETDDDSAVLYLTIEGSTFTVANDVDIDHDGALYVTGSSFEVGGQFYAYIDHISGMAFVDVDIDASDIYIYSHDSVAPFDLIVRDSSFTAATSIYVGSGVAAIVIEDSVLDAGTYIEVDTDDDGVDLTVRRSTLTAGSYVEIDAYNYGTTYLFESVTITAASFIELETACGLTIRDATMTATAGSIEFDLYGALVVESSTLQAETDVYLYTWAGSVHLLDTSISSATSYIDVDSYDPVIIDGGAIEAATHVAVKSWHAGDITIRNTASIDVGDYLYLHDGNTSYSGNNGIVTLVDNASIVIANAFQIENTFCDVVIARNALIEAGSIDWQADFSHITIQANDHIESGANVYVYAAGPSGRIAATNNMFVANAGAGTITLETQAGELIESSNTYTGTETFPNN